MLFKALQYFVVKWWDPRIRNHITYIDGETYWIYRLYLQAFITVAVCLGFFVAAYCQTSTTTMTAYLVAGVVVRTLGILELSRLTRLLHEQVKFAKLFYG